MEGKWAEYWSLSKVSQKVMKTKVHSVKLIVVDEISMVSSLTLTYMHLRLEELFGGDEWFGCRNMFVGDLLQLEDTHQFRAAFGVEGGYPRDQIYTAFSMAILSSKLNWSDVE